MDMLKLVVRTDGRNDRDKRLTEACLIDLNILAFVAKRSLEVRLLGEADFVDEDDLFI